MLDTNVDSKKCHLLKPGHVIRLDRRCSSEHRWRNVRAVVMLRSQEVLKRLVDRPRDGSTGHHVYHSRRHALKIAQHAAVGIDGPNGAEHTIDTRLSGWYRVVARLCGKRRVLSIEQCLAYVQWRRSGGGQSACHRTRQHVCHGVVRARSVQFVLAKLVHHKMQRLKRHVHSQLCRIASIKGMNALSSQYCFETVYTTLVRAVEHLQALLNN